MTFASQITSTETDKSAADLLLPENNKLVEEESLPPKDREKRAAQNVLVEEQRLLTFVNRVPVRVPVVRVGYMYNFFLKFDITFC